MKSSRRGIALLYVLILQARAGAAHCVSALVKSLRAPMGWFPSVAVYQIRIIFYDSSGETRWCSFSTYVCSHSRGGEPLNKNQSYETFID